MDSFIKVPPRSFTPACSSTWAILIPSLGQLTCMLSTCPASINRETAWVNTTSRPVGPPLMSGRTLFRYIGASFDTNDNGTNSVIPSPPYLSRLCCCNVRNVSRWEATWCSFSMWPYIIVAVVGMPREWAVEMTCIHSAEDNLPFAILFLMESSSISALVPGKLSTPASFKSWIISNTLLFRLLAPYMISSGEKAWRWTEGSLSLTALATVVYRFLSILGGRPACMHISVAPKSTASCALLTISSNGRK
mmetsp:Transcript_17295/g.16636  ORF Transcript_17295/g.16636 Transcript_17295/m.16636 type:complete len:249 (+) Transcript_17295:966-1712(+)